MSRGLGKLQRAIIDVLSGRTHQVYRFGPGSSADTYELVEEMQAAELVPENQRAAGFRVYRACLSLYHRGLLTATGHTDTDRRDVHFTWSWSLKAKNEIAEPNQSANGTQGKQTESVRVAGDSQIRTGKRTGDS
ncbi:MAG: hypothetical protein ACOYOU_13095 [Kiritimatiellia bacterium]